MVDGNGCLFETGKTDKLFENIYYLEHISEEEYERLKCMSRELYVDHYTWVVHRNNLYKAYEKALKQHDRS